MLVEATAVSVVGSEPTSALSQVIAVYERAEQAVLGVAESVAGTVQRLTEAASALKQVQMQFGDCQVQFGDYAVSQIAEPRQGGCQV